MQAIITVIEIQIQRKVEKEQREGKRYIKRAREIKRQTETESDIKI